MQKIIISGVLGADATSKEVGENVVVNFNVAVNEKRGKDEKEVTNWYACSLWRTKGKDGVSQYLKKGSGVIIDGTPDVDVWADKETKEPKGQIKITVRDLDFMSGNKKETE
ncbi:hypothetical protein FACS1894199_02800 [Bacteroidia bacterium]|nr:hypothetical protein FACS1894199_02800 [Bacteroidia bacterium]